MKELEQWKIDRTLGECWEVLTQAEQVKALGYLVRKAGKRLHLQAEVTLRGLKRELQEMKEKKVSKQ